jgi:hypothetical protein
MNWYWIVVGVAAWFIVPLLIMLAVSRAVARALS